MLNYYVYYLINIVKCVLSYLFLLLINNKNIKNKMKIIFFDMKKDLITTYKNVLSNNGLFICDFVIGTIEDIIKNVNNCALVSPANSFGYMNGTI